MKPKQRKVNIMKKLNKTALLLAVSLTALLSAGCSQERSAHKQIAGDDRVSLIEIKGKCFRCPPRASHFPGGQR
jgi:hypothetical protein